ncbi:MAG: hypothetical protein ACLTCB_00745 [Merdibacter sp.]
MWNQIGPDGGAAVDGLVLAAAGLIRLACARIARCFDEEEMVPAPAQACSRWNAARRMNLLALLRRGSDARARSGATWSATSQAMHADCHQPVGACLRHQAAGHL